MSDSENNSLCITLQFGLLFPTSLAYMLKRVKRFIFNMKVLSELASLICNFLKYNAVRVY